MFVSWHYRVSPSLADRINENPILRAVVQTLLLPFVGFGLLCLHVGFVPGFLMVLLVMTAVCFSIRRRLRA